MEKCVHLIGEDISISIDQDNFYQILLEAIVAKVFKLLGPTFDKKLYLDEVEKGRSPLEIGTSWAIPVTISLSLELGYCLGQLKCLGHAMDCDRALSDLYQLWKQKLKIMLEEEAFQKGSLH